MTNRNSEIVPLVNATFGRLIESGVSVSDQDRDDVLQAGYEGGLVGASRWVPERGSFSNVVTTYARGYMLNHINGAARGGVGSRASATLERIGLEDTVNNWDHGDNNDTVSFGARLVYDEPPRDFRDVNVEAAELQVLALIRSLPAPEYELLSAVWGIGCEAEAPWRIARRLGIKTDEVYRQVEASMSRLGFRETAAPEGWALYRQQAFARGAGASKASQPRNVIAGRPYRKGRNNLWDGKESRLTRASNRKAWAAAGRQSNGRRSTV